MTKKILITGGTGFVGSNFAHKFSDIGEDIHLITRPESNFWRIESIKNKIHLHNLDLTDGQKVEYFIKDLKPEIILHFATYGAYQGRQQDVKNTIDTNLLGTVNLINACSKIDFRCFINTGSSSEYGEKTEPMEEIDLLEPNNLYGVTKSAATLYSQFLAKKLDLPIITMRLFSVYGYYEEPGRLIPDIIKGYLQNTAPALSTPSSVRDFIFIEDVMNAYITAIEKIESIKGEVFNLGSGIQHSIADVVKAVKDIIGCASEPKYGKVTKKQHEPTVWVADISKIRDKLGWDPEFSLNAGLKNNIEWFKKHLQFYK